MKRRPELIALRVGKGCLTPADGLAASRLRARHYAMGDVVFASIRKPRSPGYHRLAHQLAALLRDNVDEFGEMDAHKVLKRLQLESGIGCEEVAFRLGDQLVIQRIPLSLSFESMDESGFRAWFAGICRHIAATYWPECGEDEIAHMAELMPGGET